MRIRFKIIEQLIFWTVLKLVYNEAIVFKMTNAVCKSYNESWISIHTCRLRAISRNVTTFNFNGTVLHPAYDIRIQGQVFKRANGYKPWLYKVDLDGCQFIKRAYNPIAIIVFKLFKEFTNFNHSCPYVGTQIVDGFYLRWGLLPHAMPTGDYMLALTWLFDKRRQFFTNVYFVFEEDLM